MPEGIKLKKRLATIKEFCRENTQFREGGIRALIFHSDDNGFRKVLVRVGRKILLDVDAFELWLDQANGRPGK